MAVQGVVRGNVIELEPGAPFPEGTMVEVAAPETGPPGDPPQGSPQALLQALDSPPHCTPEDVEILLEALRQGEPGVCFAGVFDSPEATP